MYRIIRSRQKLFLSILLFLLVFCILGLPFTQWGFKTDDWATIHHAIIKSWSNILKFFTEGNCEAFFLPSNVQPVKQAFFQGLYRPLYFLHHSLQYYLFGTNPYGYFLVSVGLHALNTVCFFLLLSRIAPITLATCSAAFFGFQPSLWNWLGWTSAQMYFTELFTFFLIIFAVLRYLKTQNFMFYLLACILYACNMFLKEQSIFFPVWLLVALHMYYQTTTDTNESLFKRLPQYLRISAGFWLIMLGYVVIRVHYFPLTADTGTLTFEPTLSSIVARFSTRFYDFVTYAVDLLGLSWQPNGHQAINAVILGSVLTLLAILFFMSTRKKLLVFCLFSIPLVSWPAILMHYQPRYLYLALPWIILFVVIALISLPCSFSKNIRIGATAAFTCLVSWNAYFLHYHLAQREAALNTITTAFRHLATQPEIANRNVCFIALPPQWFQTGSAQAVRLLCNDDTKLVFQCDANLFPRTGWLDDNYIDFIPDATGILCQSRNINKCWFETKTKEKKDSELIEIPPMVLLHKPLFIVWDYAKKQFKIITHYFSS